MEQQTLILETIMGPKDIPAPAGWEFDKTGIRVWVALVNAVKDRRKKQKTKRDEHMIDGKIVTLSNILANSLGMSNFFWQDAAEQFADTENGSLTNT